MKKEEIRERYHAAGVYQWEVAESMGIAEASLSRMLRRDITGSDLEKLLAAIDRTAAKKEAGRHGQL